MMRAVWLFMIVPVCVFAGMVIFAIMSVNDDDERR